MATVQGGSGSDSLTGTASADVIEGGAGNDTLIASDGDDTVWGGWWARWTKQTNTGSQSFTGSNGASNFSGSIASNESVTTGSQGTLSGYRVGDGDANEKHTHSFSREVAGAQIRFNALSTTEFLTITLNGVTMDLNEAIRNGYVEFSGGSEYYIDAQGRIASTTGDTDTVGTLTVLKSFTSLSVDISGTGTGAVYEMHVDTNPPTGTGDDSIDGGTGNDLIYGGDGADTILGGTGQDTIHGGTGDDYIDAGDDDDVVFGGDGRDTILGGLGNDTLYGGRGDDSISGGDGHDFLYAGTGRDTLSGGDGDDTINTLSDRDLVQLVIDKGGVSYWRLGESSGTTATDEIISNNGTYQNGVLLGQPSPTGDGNTAADFDGVNDYVTIAHNTAYEDNTGSLQLWFNADTLSSKQELFNKGGGAKPHIYLDNNTIYAEFSATNKLSLGSLSTNTWYQVVWTWDAGASTHSLYVNGALVGSGNFNRDWTSEGNPITLGAKSGGGGDFFNGRIDEVAFFNKTLTATDVADLYDGSSTNIVFGDAGNDLIIAGGGTDLIDGGTGTDTVDYSASKAGVTVNLATGTGSGGDARDDTYTSIENVIGSAYADTITGDSGVNSLSSGAGNDLLYGGAGNDTLSGGTGNDSIYGGSGNDTIDGGRGSDTLSGGTGDDTIHAGAQYTYAEAVTEKGPVGYWRLGESSGTSGSDAVGGNAGTYVNGVALGASGPNPYSTNTAADFDGLNDQFTIAHSTAYELPAGTVQFWFRPDTFGPSNRTLFHTRGGDEFKVWLNGNGDLKVKLGGIDTTYNGIGLNQWHDVSVTWSGAEAKLYVNGSLRTTWATTGTLASITGPISVGSKDDSSEFFDGKIDEISIHNSVLTATEISDIYNLGIGGQGDTNIITGGDGNDIVFANTGADQIDGGTGTDTVDYSGSDAGVTVNLATGIGSGGHAQGDTYTAVENVIGSAYADTITGDSADNTLFGGAGNDSLFGGAGNDSLSGGTGDDAIFGGTGADSLSGGAGDDALYGGDGNDTLSGRTGNDSLFGGIGNDLILGDAGADVIDGGTGTDTVDYGASAAGVTVNLATGLGTGGDAQGDTYTSVENVTGSAFADTITGSSSDNTLFGGNDADTFIVQSGYGSDTIYGGEGGTDNDTIDLSGHSGAITVTFTGDEAGTISDGLGNTVTFQEIERLILSGQADIFDGRAAWNQPVVLYAGGGDDTVYGTRGSDTLYGGDGTDTLSGGIGDDTLSGGAGDDLILGDAGADQIDGGTDTDTVDYGASAAGVTVNLATGTGSGGDAQGDTYTSVENVTGSAFADTLTGDAGANTLSGGAGNDSLSGGAGNDALYGGDGADTLSGGAGDDTLSGGAGDDLILGDAGADQIDGGTGTDTVDYGASAAGVTVNLATGLGTGGDAQGDTYTSVENVTGSAFADTITGSSSDNTLFGGNDADTFIVQSGYGSDTIYGGEGGTDNDTIDLSGHSGAVTVTFTGDEAGTISDGLGNTVTFQEIERLILSGQADIFDGRAAWNQPVVLYAGGGDDTVYGTRGSDALYGGDGTDTLSGGIGDDTLSGGAGDDLILGDAGADQIDGGTGIDTVDYGASAAGVTVNLATGTGSGGDAQGDTYTSVENVTGSAFADTLTGDAGANTLSGGAGNDSLSGGAGNDALYGGDGADTLSGGSGDDTLSGGAGDDRHVFVNGFGHDTITDFDTGDTDGDGQTNDRIDVSGYTHPVTGQPLKHSDIAIGQDGSGNAVMTFPGGDTITFLGVSPSYFDSWSQSTAMGMPCFTAGTPILTPDGERPIEEIEVGDLVMTVDHGPMPVIWRGKGHFGKTALDRDPNLRPVRIRAGTIGNHRDLLLSPQHAVLLVSEGALIRAKHLTTLVGGRARIASGVREVTYHHILLPRHSLLIAAGAMAESLYPGPMCFEALNGSAGREIARALGTDPEAPMNDIVARYGDRARPLLSHREIRALTTDPNEERPSRLDAAPPVIAGQAGSSEVAGASRAASGV